MTSIQQNFELYDDNGKEIAYLRLGVVLNDPPEFIWWVSTARDGKIWEHKGKRLDWFSITPLHHAATTHGISESDAAILGSVAFGWSKQIDEMLNTQREFRRLQPLANAS